MNIHFYENKQHVELVSPLYTVTKKAEKPQLYIFLLEIFKVANAQISVSVII